MAEGIEAWARAEAEERHPAPDPFESTTHAIRAVSRAGVVNGILHLAGLLQSEAVVQAHIEALQTHSLDYHYDSGLVIGCECGEGRGNPFDSNESAYAHVARAALAAALGAITEGGK